MVLKNMKDLQAGASKMLQTTGSVGLCIQRITKENFRKSHVLNSTSTNVAHCFVVLVLSFEVGLK